MSMIVISTTAAMCMPCVGGVRRRSRRKIGRAQRAAWVLDNHDRVEDEHFPRLGARAAYRGCCTRPCGAAHDRPANLNIPPGRKACGDDDPYADGASKGISES